MANTPPFFPFYVNDWLDDESIFDMGMECEGAYIRLLAVMWKRDGIVPDKSNWVCNALRCRPAKWRKIRAALVDEFGVFQVENGHLFNERLTKELNFFKEKCEKNAQNATKRWSKQGKTTPKKPNKNNKSKDAPAQQAECYKDIDIDTDIEVKEKDKKKRTRFTPPTLAEVQSYITEKSINIDPEKFINHYEANGWKRGNTKIVSWKACVRTWKTNSSPMAGVSQMPNRQEALELRNREVGKRAAEKIRKMEAQNARA
ncbi:MAG: YdaU family protein [Ketobacter sp.]|nr:YdaU family protein [Ketobacter sp.]